MIAFRFMMRCFVSARHPAIGVSLIHPHETTLRLLSVLTALEFDLLFCLMRSAGRVLDRDKLLDEIASIKAPTVELEKVALRPLVERSPNAKPSMQRRK